MSPWRAGILGACLGTLGAAAARGRHGRWARQNYAGRQVSLAGGPAAAAALSVAVAGSGGPIGRAATVAGLGAAAFGAIDDHVEAADDRQIKGLRGHLGALRRGKVTTGGLKLAGIGGVGVLAAALTGAARRRDSPAVTGTAAAGTMGTIGDLVIDTGVIAGTANLVNLFDLRPGRALKIVTVVSAGAALASASGSQRSSRASDEVTATAAATVATSLALLPDDLAERTMLGDTGANALGAVLGVVLAAPTSRVTRAVTLSVLVALTLVSERVSFSGFIDSHATLRRIDAWGRRSDDAPRE